MSKLKVSQERRPPFRVSSLEFQIPDLPNEFRGYKMVQLTDLHLGPMTSAAHVKKALEITAEAAPDLLLMTGDYVQYSGTGVKHVLATKIHPKVFRWTEYRRQVRILAGQLRALLQPIKPPDGILAVFGNHDYNEGIGTIRRQLPANITWLKNAAVKITRGREHLIVAGLDDHRYGKPDLKSTLQFSQNGRPPVFKVLLAHNPDVTTDKDAALLSNVDLVLSGHTHGGQICLPGGFPLATRTKQRTFFAGPCNFNGTHVYVSRGVGYGGLPLRLFCPPEVTIITLRAA